MQIPTDFLTYGALATLPGAALFVYLVVQYSTKYLPIPLGKPIYAWIVASITLMVSQVATGSNAHDWKIYPLGLANAVIVSLASGKIHDISQPDSLPLPTTLTVAGPVTVAPRIQEPAPVTTQIAIDGTSAETVVAAAKPKGGSRAKTATGAHDATSPDAAAPQQPAAPADPAPSA